MMSLDGNQVDCLARGAPRRDLKSVEGIGFEIMRARPGPRHHERLVSRVLEGALGRAWHGPALRIVACGAAGWRRQRFGFDGMAALARPSHEDVNPPSQHRQAR